MKWVLIIGGIVVGLVGVILAIGWMLPPGHVVTRTVVFKHSRMDVWNVITDRAHAPEWRTGLKSVEDLPPVEGRKRFRETGTDSKVVDFEIVAEAEGSTLVTRIVSDLPY